MERWKEVARIDSRVDPHSRLRIRRINMPSGKNYAVVEAFEKREEDITSQCTVALVQSHHSDGFYCSIFHNGKSILALGIDEASKCLLKPHYRIVKAKGASVSFRVLKDD